MRNHRMICRFLFLIFVTCTTAAPQSRPPRKDIPMIAKTAKRKVVLVVVGGDKEPIAAGTGFVVSEWWGQVTVGDKFLHHFGAAVTNYHVIAHGKAGVVKFSDGTVLPIDGILAADKVRDLAVLRIQPLNNKALGWLTLANSDRIEVGEEVVAIGNPLGLELSVSNGIVSGVRSDEKLGGKLLQITAPISHGSSGGPLFNMAGEVIGVTSMFIEGGENLNFAIPSNDVKQLIGELHIVKTLPGGEVRFEGKDITSAELKDLPNEAVEVDPKDSNAGPRNENELEDTLHWMSSSVINNSGPNWGTRVTDMTAQGCRVLIQAEVLMLAENRAEATIGDFKLADRPRFQFDLGDIDPSAISFQKWGAFTAKTTDDEKKIELKDELAISHDVIPIHTNSISFVLDKEYGPRFVKAFKHAVELCGGKPSKF